MILRILSGRNCEGEEKPEHESRRYYHEEISMLLNIDDLKLKAAIFMMASSGLRVGALPILCLGDLKDHAVVVYKDSKAKCHIYNTGSKKGTG
jgi:hypothetical protein